MNIRGVRSEVLSMPYKRNGHTTDLPVKIVSHQDVEHINAKPTLILPGLGEEGFVAAKLARTLQAAGRCAVIGVLLFPRAESIDYIAKTAPEFLARHINTMYGADPDAAVNTISHSQSAGVEVLAAHQTPQLIGGRHALIAGVGSNSPVFDGNQIAFWKRYISNLRNPGQLGPQNWRIATDLTKRLMSDTVGSLLTHGEFLIGHKVKYALDASQFDTYKDNLANMVTSSSTAIITGEHDPLFPEVEARQYVGDTGVNFISTVGAHENMVGKLGLQQVATAFEWLDAAA